MVGNVSICLPRAFEWPPNYSSIMSLRWGQIALNLKLHDIAAYVYFLKFMSFSEL